MVARRDVPIVERYIASKVNCLARIELAVQAQTVFRLLTHKNECRKY